jgi:hypothetical protein
MNNEYDAWFTVADVDQDGRVSGAEAVHFFMRAQLPKDQLVKLWDAADPDGVGYLDRSAFSLACTLIGALQHYGTITRNVYERVQRGDTASLPTPKMMGLELPSAYETPVVAQQQMAVEEAAPVAAYAGESQANERRVNAGFENFGGGQQSDGSFASPAQDDFFAMSGWANEFANGDAAASQPVEAQTRPQPTATEPAMLTFDAPPSSSTRAVPSGEPYAMPPVDIAPSYAAVGPPLPEPPVSVSPPQPWPEIGPSDWQRYQQLFLANTNGAPDGRLSGQQISPILLSIDAPKHVLKDIWELSDIDKDGALSWLEFVVAVYLTEQARDGRMPPATLPPGQFPPFSMTPGSAQQQTQAVQPPLQNAAPAQQFTMNTNGLVTPSDARRQLENLAAAQNVAPDEEYRYRGPMANAEAMPEQDRELTARVKADAENRDRELWEQEMRERQNNLSAHAAQEVLSNLALFVRKCEASITEAAYRADSAESQVNELRAKCDAMRAKVEALAAQLSQPIERIEASKKEHAELSNEYRDLETRHAALTQQSREQPIAPRVAPVQLESRQENGVAQEQRQQLMTAPTTTAAPQKASAPLVDFGFGEPQAAASPASVKAKSTFDEWDSWGRTTREETPETTAASPPKATAPTAHPAPTTAAARHQKTPSEIPAVAAALGDGNEGGFFDDFDADPFAAAASPPPNPEPYPCPDPSDASLDDDPFGVPPSPGPTPGKLPIVDASFDDDPFGAPPPTPPGSTLRPQSSLDLDPFAF